MSQTVCLLNGSSVRSNPRPQICTLLGYRTSNGWPLHLSLVVDNDSCIVFKVDEDTILPSERLPLPDDDCRHDLLPQLWFSFLDGGNNHVSSPSSRKSIESSLDSKDGDDIEVFTSSVVSAVDNSTNRETKGDPKLGSSWTSSSYLTNGKWHQSLQHINNVLTSLRHGDKTMGSKMVKSKWRVFNRDTSQRRQVRERKTEQESKEGEGDRLLNPVSLAGNHLAVVESLGIEDEWRKLVGRENLTAPPDQHFSLLTQEQVVFLLHLTCTASYLRRYEGEEWVSGVCCLQPSSVSWQSWLREESDYSSRKVFSQAAPKTTAASRLPLAIFIRKERKKNFCQLPYRFDGLDTTWLEYCCFWCEKNTFSYDNRNVTTTNERELFLTVSLFSSCRTLSVYHDSTISNFASSDQFRQLTLFPHRNSCA